MHKISFYEGEYYFLSNFSSHMVHYSGVDYMTAEHAYQAEKFTVVNQRKKIEVTNAPSAYDAKRIARGYKEFMRDDWCDELKLLIMGRIVRAKFRQHKDIQDEMALIEKGMEIEEDSPTDDFWGRGPFYNGKNHLGKIWMEVHAESMLEEVSAKL